MTPELTVAGQALNGPRAAEFGTLERVVCELTGRLDQLNSYPRWRLFRSFFGEQNNYRYIEGEIRGMIRAIGHLLNVFDTQVYDLVYSSDVTGFLPDRVTINRDGITVWTRELYPYLTEVLWVTTGNHEAVVV